MDTKVGVRAVSLQGKRIAQTIPVLQMRYPELTLESLECSLHHQNPNAEDTGLIAFETDRGYIVGLFVYHVLNDLLQGTILVITDFISTDVMGRYGTVDTMIDEIDRLAQRKKVDQVHVTLSGDTAHFPRGLDQLTARFRAAGHQFEGTAMKKAP